MFRFIFYFLTFVFFASPASLYLLFKKESLNKVTKFLKIIFLIKFLLFDLIFYLATFFVETPNHDNSMRFFVFGIFLIFNLIAILVYNIYFSNSVPIEKITSEIKEEIISEKSKKTNRNNLDSSLDSTKEEFYTLPELINILENEYVDTGKVLNFEYQGARDIIPLNREVIVRRVYEKNNTFYMDTVDLDSKRPKMFRLDRITFIDF